MRLCLATQGNNKTDNYLSNTSTSYVYNTRRSDNAFLSPHNVKRDSTIRARSEVRWEANYKLWKQLQGENKTRPGGRQSTMYVQGLLNKIQVWDMAC